MIRYTARIGRAVAVAALVGIGISARAAEAQVLPVSPLGITGTSAAGTAGMSALAGQGTTSGFVNGPIGFFTSSFGGPFVTGFGGFVGLPGWTEWWGPWEYGYADLSGAGAFPEAYTPPWAYTRANLPLLGINTSARTVGGFPARYVRTTGARP
jgi:hypothetical protein